MHACDRQTKFFPLKLPENSISMSEMRRAKEVVTTRKHSGGMRIVPLRWPPLDVSTSGGVVPQVNKLNRFPVMTTRYQWQGGLNWTGGGGYGIPGGRVCDISHDTCEVPTPPPWTDRHLWKHYLFATSFAASNKKWKEILGLIRLSDFCSSHDAMI